ncbi:MAG: orotate phosphoribosyltransferase [Deltaproteobacteria bacterium]|nr:MAG: orotate phosphoribosyltransferase [Deltaproteobacteria bacterium]
MNRDRDPNSREALAALLARRSYRRGRFRLASGRESDFYVDVKQTVLTAEGADLIGRLLFEVVEELGASQVGGMAVGAVPLITAVLCRAAPAGRELSGFFVRKQAKDHGTAATIDGPFRPEAATVLLEDVVTTGESTLRALDAVEAAGGRVTAVIAVVDREEDDGLERIAARVDRVVALARRRDIVAAAEKNAEGR